MKDSKNRANASIKGGVRGKGLTTALQIPLGVRATCKKQGLGPDFVKTPTKASTQPTVQHVPVSDLRVALITGDDGLLHYRFMAAGAVHIIGAKEVVESPQGIAAKLTKLRILATSKEDKAAISALIQTAQGDPDAVVATRAGFERSNLPRYFVYGDGTVIAPHSDVKVHPIARKSGRFERKGKLRVYEDGIAKAIRNQPIPIAMFFYGLTQAVKPFVSGTGYKAENMMFELVGETSTYKSALTSTLAGSIWGKANSPDGYARSWNMSEQNIENLFQEFNDHLLILDEATLAQSNDRARAERILNTVHRLSSGQGRDRPGEEAEGHSVAMLSNSNQPIRSILPATEEVRRALEVRLISFELPDRDTGFFDHVPKSFTSLRAAMQQVFDVTRDHYGLLARRFITNMLKLAREDLDGLTQLLNSSMTEFLEEVGLDVNASDRVNYRRVQPFALACATARLAFKTGTLRKPLWGDVEYSIRRAWLDHARIDIPVDGDATFNSYMTATSNIFVDLRGKPKPELSDDDLVKIAGFINKGKDGSLRMAVPAVCIDKTGYGAAALKRLKQEGVLRAGEGLRTKRNYRTVNGEEKRDAYYVFVINGTPPDIRYWSTAGS